MTARFYRRLAAGLLAAAVGVCPAASREDWRIEDGRLVFDRDGTDRGGFDRLDLTLLEGDVRVEGTDADVVVVTWIAQRHPDDPRQARIGERDDDGTKVLTPGFDELEIEEHETWRNRRMDVGIALPRDLALTIRTESGSIEVEKHAAEVRLTSVSGDIAYDGEGALEARSGRGRVRALIRSTRTDAPVRVETRTGEIWLQLLEGASAAITLETQGSITTDYSVAVEREPGKRFKKATATVGSGRRPMTLVSHAGSIRLMSLIAPENPGGQAHH